jgi:hypothetical protein
MKTNLTMKKTIYLFVLILICNCRLSKIQYDKKISFEIISLNGVVQYNWKNSSNEFNGFDNYYKKNNSYFDNMINYPFIDDCTGISIYCNENTINEVLDKYNNNITDYEQYFSQNISNPQAGVYYGGDIYYTNEQKDIAIAFHLIGKGIIFHSVCKDYIKYENYYEDCPIKPSAIKTPFIAFLEVDTIYSLNAEQQKMCQLTKSNLKSFTVNLCE